MVHVTSLPPPRERAQPYGAMGIILVYCAIGSQLSVVNKVGAKRAVHLTRSFWQSFGKVILLLRCIA